MKGFLWLYDLLHTRRWMRGALLLGLLGLLVSFALTLRYQEDISAFLPLDAQQRRAMGLWQNISASDRLVVLFEHWDTATVDVDRLIAAVDTFGILLKEGAPRDIAVTYAPQIDYDRLAALTDIVLDRIPLFLTEADYRRMETMCTDTVAVRKALVLARDRLLSPAGSSGQVETLQRDPLELFLPVVRRLRQYQAGVRHNLHDGYIFTPDDRKAIAMLSSPYGSSETARNAELMSILNRVSARVMTDMPDVYLHIVGAPAIAVTNASQIKADSILAISIAVVLILFLLLYAFRSFRSLFFIVVSVGFGWLFAMAGIAWVHNRISVIVLGIASVIIGIAVNYPLHYVAHLQHQPLPRTALREIVTPLLIGNVTTVGAFLCLVPLEAPALRDLGVFSSLMLVGTILFVLIFLPHWVGSGTVCRGGVGEKSGGSAFSWAKESCSGLPQEGRRWLGTLAGRRYSRFAGWMVFLVLTLFFGYRSMGVSFDTDLHHINYMTDEQRRDLAAFAALQGEAQTETVYVAAEDTAWDAALSRMESLQSDFTRLQASGMIAGCKNPTDFLPSRRMQSERWRRWLAFYGEHGENLLRLLRQEASTVGFRKEAFLPFEECWTRLGEGLSEEERTASRQDFLFLAETVFGSYRVEDSTTCTVIAQLQVVPDKVDSVEAVFREEHPDLFVFDIAGINRSVSRMLSDQFNYIGWACGLIVFAFLWLSFGRLELAALAFLPMAVSWLWILGIMELFDIRFNIVNVILATFIFGQGDDYTIFITEGLMYEHAYRRRLLASYKQSILFSALIMFIGIGSLVVARHPALFSLAEVTIVGMISVVLMAWLLPPAIFGFLVRHGDGGYRDVPLTFSTLLSGLKRPQAPATVAECRRYVIAKYAYKGADVERCARRFFRTSPEMLSRIEDYAGNGPVVILGNGQGEAGLVCALLHPAVTVYACDDDPDCVALAASCSLLPPNLHILTTSGLPAVVRRDADAIFDFN